MQDSALTPMVWANRSDIDNAERCAACGKTLKDPGAADAVEVINGGLDVGSPVMKWDTTDSGYMGFFRVGPVCAKKYFHGFVH